MDVDALLFIVRADLKGKSVERQREVARESDLAWSTVRKLIDGDENVTVKTLRKLHRHYFGQQSQAARQQAASAGNRRQMG